jgi:peptidoglycan/xylan/chitin deacetylase (PgdA/CDA1 family)
MSKFSIVTVLIIIALLAIGFRVEPPLRHYLWASVVIIYLVLLGLGTAFIRLNYFTAAICHGDRRSKSVSITFDDGPEAAVTPLLLDLLKKHSVSCAFFCIGERVLSNPEIVRQIVEEGHLLCNHSFRHKWWTNFMLSGGLTEEIEKAQQAIEKVADQKPKYFRPLAGLTNPHLPRALKKTGVILVGWDVGAFDRQASSPEVVIERILRRLKGGSIIMLHDGGTNSDILLAIVSGLLVKLKDRGYSSVRLDKLIEE